MQTMNFRQLISTQKRDFIKLIYANSSTSSRQFLNLGCLRRIIYLMNDFKFYNGVLIVFINFNAHLSVLRQGVLTNSNPGKS